MSTIERDIQQPIPIPINAWHKATAVLEIVGMLAAANAIFWRVGPLLGMPSLGPLLQSAANGGAVNQTYLGEIFLLHLALRGAVFLGVVFALDLVMGRRDRYRHGLSLAGRRTTHLLFVGFLAGCVAGLPMKCLALSVYSHLLHSSGGSSAYMFVNRHWGVPFWCLYVLSMCVVVPFHEEFFFRGYAQRRLEDAFGVAGSIVLGALFFTLQHLSEYLYRLDVANMRQLLCMAFDAVLLGYLYWRTRSLLPCILSHASGNAPIRGFHAYLIATLIMLLVVATCWRRCLRHARIFLQQIQTPDPTTLAATCLLLMGMVILELFGNRVIWPYLCALLIALCFEPKGNAAPAR